MIKRYQKAAMLSGKVCVSNLIIQFSSYCHLLKASPAPTFTWRLRESLKLSRREKILADSASERLAFTHSFLDFYHYLRPLSGFRRIGDSLQLQEDSLREGSGGWSGVGPGEASVPTHHGHLRHRADRKAGASLFNMYLAEFFCYAMARRGQVICI